MTVRRIAHAFAAVLATATLLIVFPGPAQALGGETLECTVTPNSPAGTGHFSNACGSSRVSGNYGVTFEVFNTSAGETFSWSGPAGKQQLANCTTNNATTCQFNLDPRGNDIDDVVTVVVSQGGAQETLTAEVDLNAVCTFNGRLVFC